MNSIALLVPVCSRNQNYKTFADTPFVKYLFPSFIRTFSVGYSSFLCPQYIDYSYTFYIGMDETDHFYTSRVDDFNKFYGPKIDIKCVFLKDCEHKPAHAWNRLFEIAYNDNHDYFYQIGDDIEMLDPWTDTFIQLLKARENKGVVGARHDVNYFGRIQQGKTPVIENAFVHRTHYQLFKTFFNKEIENWYCDDWITEVYKPHYSTICSNIKIKNNVMDRYKIKNIGEKIKKLIKQDKKIIA